MCLARGGVGGVGGRRLELGFTNPVVTASSSRSIDYTDNPAC